MLSSLFHCSLTRTFNYSDPFNANSRVVWCSVSVCEGVLAKGYVLFSILKCLRWCRTYSHNGIWNGAWTGWSANWIIVLVYHEVLCDRNHLIKPSAVKERFGCSRLSMLGGWARCHYIPLNHRSSSSHSDLHALISLIFINSFLKNKRLSASLIV